MRKDREAYDLESITQYVEVSDDSVVYETIYFMCDGEETTDVTGGHDFFLGMKPPRRNALT